MSKLPWRYLIYFGIFICFVQIMESAPLQGAFAKVGLKMNFESLGTYAPLFLSALLIDITYRIGKRQNEIAEQQNILAEKQLKETEYKVNRDIYVLVKDLNFHIYHILSTCHSSIIWGKGFINQQMSELQKTEKLLSELEIDIELRFCNNRTILDYNFLIQTLSFLLNILSESLQYEVRPFDVIIKYEDFKKLSDREQIEIIASYIVDENKRNIFIRQFEYCIDLRKSIIKNNLQQKIKDHLIQSSIKKQ